MARLTQADIVVGNKVGVVGSRGSSMNIVEIIRVTKTQITVKYPSGAEYKHRMNDFTQMGSMAYSRWSAPHLTTVAEVERMRAAQERSMKLNNAWHTIESVSRSRDITKMREAMATLEAAIAAHESFVAGE